MKNNKKTKRTFLCFVLLTLCLIPAIAICSSHDSTFSGANALYEKGEYDKAIAEYEKIVNAGLESGNLYYNIGNCYFKKGSLGKAILNYEKAERLIPRDKDLESNYKYANSMVKYNMPKAGKICIIRFAEKFSDEFTINELTILMSVIYVLIVLVVIACVIFKTHKRNFNAAASILILIFALCCFSFRTKLLLLNREAVIIKETSSAKFEPFDRATTHFKIYEGMKVYVLSSNGNWYKIKRPDGKTGWVKKESAELI